MTSQEKTLLEKRSAVALEMRKMVEKAESEDRGLTSEERGMWDAMGEDVSALDSRIEVLRKTDFGVEDVVASEERQAQPEMAKGEAFNAFMRSHPELSPASAEVRKVMAEMRAQSTGTDSAGGYLVPEEWASSIEGAMKAYGGIRNEATIIRSTNGSPLHMPTEDNTSQVGAILGENTQDSEQDVTFNELILGAYKYTSNIIRVPVELLQDSMFNLESFLQGKFAERLGRATSAHYATGTGTGQPTGLFTAATSGKTAASNSALAWAELIDLKHSVDPAYRGNAAWLMNDSTLATIKKLVDSQNRPLWLPSVAGSEPGTFDGDRIVIDQGAPSIGSATTPIAYGDLSKYQIRDVAGISMMRLVERYADFHQVGFVATMRTDGNLLDAGANPIKLLTMAV